MTGGGGAWERGGSAAAVELGEDVVEFLRLEYAFCAPALKNLCAPRECDDQIRIPNASVGAARTDLYGAHEVRHALLARRDDIFY